MSGSNMFQIQKFKLIFFKVENDLAGYFELVIHDNIQEIEIAYLGLLRGIS